MIIKGFIGVTLIDFPGRVASTVFTGGCHFRCPYCYNRDLVLRPGTQPTLPTEEILLKLGQRKGFIEGVVVTGGEPTEHPDLPEFLRALRDMGLLAKLDTNGSAPQAIEGLLEGDLVEFISMDFKAPLSRYSEFVRAEVDTQAIQRSLEIVQRARVQVELRTTIHPRLHREKDLEDMAPQVNGQTAWVWQPVYPAPTLDPSFEVAESPELAEYRCRMSRLAERFPNVRMRGMPPGESPDHGAD